MIFNLDLVKYARSINYNIYFDILIFLKLWQGSQTIGDQTGRIGVTSRLVKLVTLAWMENTRLLWPLFQNFPNFV